MSTANNNNHQTLFGHPTGLFTLFFAEMWERFSYYGMRAILLLYMLKGFLGYGDSDAYAVYGAYTALVYMTPFFGGMIADRLLGPRRAVVLGGVLMATGQAMLMVQEELAFFLGLGLLIAGNGFFKPNISTMVGSLYPQGSPRRDGGFTIFYMGINLGAAMAPLLCGYIGETYDWSYGFGLATIGMLTGIAVFVAPIVLTQILIMSGALAAAILLFIYHPDNPYVIGVHVLVGIVLIAAGIIAVVALSRGGLPSDVGAPPDRERLRRPVLGPVNAEWTVYLLTLVSIPVLVLLVSGFSPLTPDGRSVTIVPDETIKNMEQSSSAAVRIAATVVKEMSKPAGLVLLLAGIVAFGYLGAQTARLSRIARQRMYVVFILTFFSMLFWAFFEQAGSSVNNFTDRNVNRVPVEGRTVTPEEVGETITIQPTQEQLGYHNGDKLFTLDELDKLREEQKERKGPEDFTIEWEIAPDNVGMKIVSRNEEIPASVLQSVNPIYILLLGLVFTALWTFLGARGLEPNTAVKFSLGLFQLGLGFGCFWYGAQHADERGMVALSWLFLGYLLHTTGELCLSPVGLAMITRLTPAFLVSTVMGAWFLATAFSQFLAAIIAQFTSVSHGGDGSSNGVPPPTETLHAYGDVFGPIAVTAMASGLICFVLSPILKRWMHEGVRDEHEPGFTPPEPRQNDVQE